MSKKLFPLLLFALVLFACEKDESPLESDTYSYTYSTSSKIETTIDTLVYEYTLQDSAYIDTIISVSSGVVAGENYVFRYTYTYDDELEIVDDEYAESFFIEIPVSGDTFSYDSDELKGLNTAFNYYCFCPTLGLTQADSGRISGVKMDDSHWKIELDARFTGEQDGNNDLFQKRFSFTKVFTEE